MSETAILLFIRSEQDEIRHKRLIKWDDSGNQDVIRVLNNRIVRTANETELPCFVIDSHHQIGSGFAERLQNAFAQIFDLGFSRVISVGNDIPNLTAQHILEADRQLHTNDVCFGRTQKQGIYLFGLNHETFKKIDFSAINWQESSLIPSIRIYSEEINANWKELAEQLHELNTSHDIKQFLKSTEFDKTDFLLQLLNELYQSPQHFFSYRARNNSISHSSNFLLRGPPSAR